MMAVKNICTLWCLLCCYIAAADDYQRKIKVVFSAPSPVLSSKVPAQVVDIHKRFGENFAKGELLISMDDTFFRANAEAADSVVHAMKVKHDALASLHKDGNASVVELEKVRSEYSIARKNAVQAREQWDGCRVYAPFDGRVTKELVFAHEQVKVDQPLIKVVNDSTLLAQFLLPERMFKYVESGRSIRIVVKALQTVVAGSVKYISAEIDPVSQTFEVKAEVDNRSGELRSGMTGEIDLNMVLKYVPQPEKTVSAHDVEVE